MKEFSSAGRDHLQLDGAALEIPASAWQRKAALCTLIIVGSFAAIGTLFGSAIGPISPAFVPIVATAWSLADLLTAFLLLGQFYFNGRVGLAVVAAAYGFNGLLTWPYMASFPGIAVRTGAATLGEQQVSLILWSVWHCAFPVVIVCAVFADRSIGRMVSRKTIRTAVAVIGVATVAVAFTVSAMVYGYRDHLPHVIVAGHFQVLWKVAFVPSIVLLNALGCLAVWRRRQNLTVLSLWLNVALVSAAIDALLNLSAVRHSWAWDAGKLIALFTSSVVLVTMLGEVVGIYGRLALAATVDVLTSLKNRRAFEDHLESTFYSSRRLEMSMAVLMIDVDFFKRYNDSHGHLAGDECLRRIAKVMLDSVTRPLDLVARYGGEEFVVVLPDTPEAGVVALAERIRSLVEQLEMGFCAAGVGRTTVSIGAAFAANARDSNENALMDAADRALYAAKDAGRNRVVLSGAVPAPAPQGRLEQAPAVG